MSEILLRLNPVTGKVDTVEIVADDEKSQRDGIERLQYYLKDIYDFSRKTTERAWLYRLLNPEREKSA
jgi:hypothetical protein